MKKLITLLALCYLMVTGAWADVQKLRLTFSNFTSTGATVSVIDQSGTAVTGVSASVSQAVQNGSTNKEYFTSGAGCNAGVLGVKYDNAQNNYWEITFTVTGLSSFNGREIPSIDVCTPLLNSGNDFQGDVVHRTWNRTLTVDNTQYGETLVDVITNDNNHEVWNHFENASATISGGQLVLKAKMEKTDAQGCFAGVKYIDINMPTMQTYTVNVTGATGGGVIYAGDTYNDGAKITATGLSVTDLVATSVEGYMPTITIDDLTINVEYVNVLNASIYYTPLTTDCWSEWSGDIPSDVSYEASALRVLEETIVVEQRGTLKSTIVYTGGNHRTELAGIDIVDESGKVVAHDYHFGWSGSSGTKLDNVYTISNIPEGTYTIRYIAHYDANGSANTNGHFDNVFTSGADWTGLEEVLALAASYTIGEGLGEYAETEAFSEAYSEAYTVWYLHDNSGIDADADAVAEAITNLQTAIAGLQLNMPKPGTFLRVKGAASSKYIAGDNSISNGRAAMTAEKDASSILYYTENNELIGYQSGLGFINTHSRAAVGNTFEHHSFSASNYGNKGAYTIQSNYGGSKVLYDGGTDINRNSAANSVNCAWYLEEVTSLPVEFKEAAKDATTNKYYSTLYSPVALTIDGVNVMKGVKAYIATTNENDHLIVSPLENAVIPANTPVVLESSAAGTVNIALNPSSTEEPATGNLLRGTVYTKTSTEGQGNYVLSIVDGKVGFYKFVGSSLQGFKTYYNPAENGSTSSRINGFSLDFGGQTVGVNSVISATNLKAGYDIQGRKLNKIQKGINILGGKKIIK